MNDITKFKVLMGTGLVLWIIAMVRASPIDSVIITASVLAFLSGHWFSLTAIKQELKQDELEQHGLISSP